MNIQILTKFRTFIGPMAWRSLILATVIGISSFVIESSFLWVIQIYFSSFDLMHFDQNLLNISVPKSKYIGLAALIIFGVLKTCLYSSRAHITSMISQHFLAFHRKRLLDIATANSQISTSTTISYFTEITTQASALVYHSSQLLISLIMSLSFMILAAKLAFFETIIGIALLGFALLPLKGMGKAIDLAGKETTSLWEKINENVILTLNNYFLLKIYGLLDQQKTKSQGLVGRYLDVIRSYAFNSSLKAGLPFLFGISIISIITFISQSFLHTAAMSLVSFFYIFIRLSQSMSDANASVAAFKLSMPSFKALYLFELNNIKYISVSNQAIETEIVIKGDIDLECKNVTYGYDDTLILKNFSFSFNAKTLTVIKGKSGAGKSTLISLITGVLRPQSGLISINNIPINKCQKNLCEHIGYVGPDPFIIEGTLRDNIMFGSHSTKTDIELGELARKSGFLDIINRLPNGLNEHIFELAQLSTGQKQRLALTRALARTPKLLILDEATANLDTETENFILNEINKLKKEMTIIVISHKDSFDSIADNILQL